MLHVTNGEAAASGLREAGLPGTVVSAADVLHDGPCPETTRDEDWYAVRAGYLAQYGDPGVAGVARDLRSADEALAGPDAAGGIVLWFEADLFDQLNLIRVLDRVAARVGELSLICIGEHPDVPDFVGLGPLSPAQLAALYPDRRPVTPAQVALARDAWARFRRPSPVAWRGLLDEDTGALPFLREAVLRQLEELPGAIDGLSRSERQALEAVAAGAETAAEAFGAAARREERVWCGDWPFLTRLRDMGPLLTLDGDGLDLRAIRVALTDHGRRVLAGDADRVAVAGLDRWWGGTRLTPETAWRWDGHRRALIPPGGAR